MKTGIQPGRVLSLTAPADVLSGQMLLIGMIFGIAVHNALSGETVEVQVDEVHELPKKDSDDIEAGDLLFFDSAQNELTLTAGGNRLVGAAVEDADNTASVVKVRLNASFGAGQAANVAAEATANGSDAATTQALANALKTKVNAILTAMKAAGIMTAD